MAISSEQYRDCMRHFTAGVTIVTIKSEGVIHGLTVSAFASVSPDPPLILVVIDQRHNAYELMQKEDSSFAVNILGAEKMELSNRFAWLKDDDRFSAGDWATAVTGAPILRDALAWLDCTISAGYTAGTHMIYVGEVQAAGVPQPDKPPLVYWNRGYRQLRLHDSKQDP